MEMSFTRRFIKVTMQIFNSKEQDLFGKPEVECSLITIYRMINPFCIEAYYPCIPSGLEFVEGNLTATYVYMKSGESFMAALSISEFEELLNKGVV